MTMATHPRQPPYRHHLRHSRQRLANRYDAVVFFAVGALLVG